MTDAEVHEYLHGVRTMTVATLGVDGRPHLVAVWYAFLDGAPAFWTYRRAQKVVNLRRDPRITCLVEDGDRYESLRGVELVGRGVLVDDLDTVTALGLSLLERYEGPTGEARAAMIASAAKRVAVRVEADKVVSWDHAKLVGTY